MFLLLKSVLQVLKHFENIHVIGLRLCIPQFVSWMGESWSLWLLMSSEMLLLKILITRKDNVAIFFLRFIC